MKNREGILDQKRLAIINFTIVSFFLLIYLINLYKIDLDLIDAIRELLTIPFLISQIVFLTLSIKILIKDNKGGNYLLVSSVIALAICTFFTLGSFF